MDSENSGSAAYPDGMDGSGSAMDPAMGGSGSPGTNPQPPQALQLIPMGRANPAAMQAHPFAELLPPMRDSQFEELKESIELDGLQTPVVLFRGQILDGRNRCRACAELGIPVQTFEFMGTDEQALIYVLSANQHRRDLTASQRAAVAVEFMPRISEEVNRRRIEKIRRARAETPSDETLSILTGSGDNAADSVTSRAIAADMMGVSDGYVGHAKRIKDQAPPLFEQVRTGEISIPEALRRLDQTPDDPRAARIQAVRTRLNRLLRSPDAAPQFLDQLEALIAQFEPPGE